jgi:hypothetical protein
MVGDTCHRGEFRDPFVLFIQFIFTLKRLKERARQLSVRGLRLFVARGNSQFIQTGAAAKRSPAPPVEAMFGRGRQGGLSSRELARRDFGARIAPRRRF